MSSERVGCTGWATKYREGLYPLESFTKEDAKEVLSIIHKWQKKAYDEFGYHFIHAGDEWYILAEEEMPEEERYDGLSATGERCWHDAAFTE